MLGWAIEKLWQPVLGGRVPEVFAHDFGVDPDVPGDFRSSMVVAGKFGQSRHRVEGPKDPSIREFTACDGSLAIALHIVAHAWP